MTVVCFVETDLDAEVIDPATRALSLARSLAEEDGQGLLAVVVASRTNPETVRALASYGVAEVCALSLPPALGYAPRPKSASPESPGNSTRTNRTPDSTRSA